MTEKELRRLSRKDLLEMLLDQSVEMQKTKKRLRIAEKQLRSRKIAISKAGSIANAALQLNGVFEAAQASCEQYTENVRVLLRRQEKICRQREEEAVQRSNALIKETEERCAAMEAEAKARCAQMIKRARMEAAALKNGDEPAKKAEEPAGATLFDKLGALRRRNRRSEKG